MAQLFITRRIFDEAITLLEEAGLEYDHNAADNPLSASDIQARAADAEGLICLLTDPVDAALMDSLPHLKVIANVAVGYDNIDVTAASKRGIVVTNTPDVLTEATADLAFALLLAVARRVVDADRYMRAGEFEGWELFQPHLGVDVFGKTLGILGMGRIGSAVAQRGALGFGMDLIYSSNRRQPAAEREFGARHVSFEELLQQSDFLSIHTPLTPQTHHLFTLRQFEQMKPSAFLINTARGPIVKEEDLVMALHQGLIRGAGLDVFENEPEMHASLAELREDVVVLPHIGSATTETRQRMSTTAVRNAIAALQGECPPNALNPEAWEKQ